LAAAVCLVAAARAPGGDVDSPEYWRGDWKRLGALGKGFVVWESNRGGAYRIWYRNLDGTGLRRVSPDEKKRWHYAAHVSPDGKRLVYLSFPPNRWRDGYVPTPKGRKTPMHIINVDGTGDRVLLDNARTYLSHRAALWVADDELICIDGNGYSIQLNVDTGRSVRLTKEPDKEFGWLINRTKTHATSRAIWITFSKYDAKAKTITKTKVYGGCMPYFSWDGVWAFYVGGSGGPLNRVLLSTGKASPILRKSDPRMPKQRRFVYGPMLSANQRLFAFIAAPKSTWERDPRSDFDIFVAHMDPETLTIIGKPARYTFNKSQDRYPDVFLDPIDKTGTTRRAAAPAVGAAKTAPPWPTKRKGLVFLWENSEKANLAKDPATGKQRSYTLNFRGRSWLDRNYALHLTGKGSVLAEEAGASVTAACKKTGAFSVEATVVSATHGQGSFSAKKGMRPARIITLGAKGEGATANFSLVQASGELFFHLRTSKDEQASAWTRLNCRVRTGQPVHVVVTCAPGILTAYANGQVVMEAAWPLGSFAGWSPGRLVLGGLDGAKDAWSGTLEGVAIYDRSLGPEQVWRHYSYSRDKIRSRKPVAKLRVQAKLVAMADIPSLEKLGAYRQSLVVFEYELHKVLDKGKAPPRFRVAHWGILDRKVVKEIAERRTGRVYSMVLEPYAANEQLKTSPRSDSPLKENFDIPLYFETGR